MNLYFTYESRGTPTSFTLFINVKTITNEIRNTAINLKRKFKKIIRRCSRSPDNVEFSSHFLLLFCRGRSRNVPRIITHTHSLALLINLLFSDFPFPSWFSFKLRKYNRELKQWRRRPCRQRLVINEFIFYLRIPQLCAYWSQNLLKLNM